LRGQEGLGPETQSARTTTETELGSTNQSTSAPPLPLTFSDRFLTGNVTTERFVSDVKKLFFVKRTRCRIRYGGNARKQYRWAQAQGKVNMQGQRDRSRMGVA